MLRVKTVLLAAALGASFTSTSFAHELGFAGLLSGKNKGEMPALALAAGQPLSPEPTITLESGKYYELEIVSDGSQELALTGSDFFRAIWIDEVVINELEVRPYGIDSVEFDDEGEMEIGFVAIKPGSYRLSVPGSTGETMGVDIIIK